MILGSWNNIFPLLVSFFSHISLNVYLRSYKTKCRWQFTPYSTCLTHTHTHTANFHKRCHCNKSGTRKTFDSVLVKGSSVQTYPSVRVNQTNNRRPQEGATPTEAFEKRHESEQCLPSFVLCHVTRVVLGLRLLCSVFYSVCSSLLR